MLKKVLLTILVLFSASALFSQSCDISVHTTAATTIGGNDGKAEVWYNGQKVVLGSPTAPSVCGVKEQSPYTCLAIPSSATVLSSPSTWITMGGGTTYFITAANYTGNITFTGPANVVICGNVTLQNINFNNQPNDAINFYINGSLTTSYLNAQPNVTIKNYGTLTVQGAGFNGKLYNHGNFTCSSDFSVNSNLGSLYNSGTFVVNSSLNINQPTLLTNNGTITIGGALHDNSNGSIVNNCTITVAGDFTKDGSLTNAGSIIVANTTTINSGLYQAAAGSLLQTQDLMCNSTITGTGSSCASVKVTRNTTINGTGKFQGAVDLCKGTGSYTNTGTFVSPATSNCSCTISSPSTPAVVGTVTWSAGTAINNGNEVQNLSAGNYTATIAIQGCATVTKSFTITQPTVTPPTGPVCDIQIQTTPASTYGGSDGTAEIWYNGSKLNLNSSGCTAKELPTLTCSNIPADAIVLANPTTSLTMGGGNTYYITAANFTGNITFTGPANVIICGNTTLQYINFNNQPADAINIYVNGSLTTPYLNLNANVTVKNYGTLTMQGAGFNGKLYNHGTVVCQSDFNVNSIAGMLYNTGTFNITNSLNVNQSSIFTNGGKITMGGDFHNNGSGSFVNNCSITVGGNFFVDGPGTNNGGITVANTTYINSGTLQAGNGSLLQTKDLMCNATVSGIGTTCASVKVTGNTTINGSGKFQGKVDFCKGTGSYTNYGSFIAPATANCTCSATFYAGGVNGTVTWTAGTAINNGAAVQNLPAGTISATVAIEGCSTTTVTNTISQPAPSSSVACSTLTSSNCKNIDIVYNSNGEYKIICNCPDFSCSIKDATGKMIPSNTFLPQPDKDQTLTVIFNSTNGGSSDTKVDVTVNGKSGGNPNSGSSSQYTYTGVSSNTAHFNSSDSSSININNLSVFVNGLPVSTDNLSFTNNILNIAEIPFGTSQVQIYHKITGELKFIGIISNLPSNPVAHTDETQTYPNGDIKKTTTSLVNNGESVPATSATTNIPGLTTVIENGEVIINFTEDFNETHPNIKQVEVTITTPDGKTVIEVIPVVQPCTLALNLVQVSPTCHDGTNGSLEITNLPANSSITWQYGNTTASTPKISGLSTNLTYSYNAYQTLSDGTSCLLDKKNNIQLENPAAITAEIVPTEGVHNFIVNATGGTQQYTYAWSDGQTSAIVHLNNGINNVTITDANACKGGAVENVSNPPCEGTISTSFSQPSSDTDKDGTISASYTTSGKTFTWTSTLLTQPFVGANLTNVGVGKYDVAVTPNTGCDAGTSVTLYAASKITASITPTSSNTAQINPSNVTNPVYNLVTGTGTSGVTIDANGIISGLTSGQEIEVEICNNSCSTSVDKQSITLTYTHNPCLNPNLKATVAFDQTTPNLAKATVTDGASPYLYQWLLEGQTASATGYTSTNTKSGVTGNNVLYVKDNNGCTTSTPFSPGCGLTTPIPATITPAQCARVCDGSIRLASLPTGFNVKWNGSAGTALLQNICKGDYIMTLAKDDATCAYSQLYAVTEGTCTLPPDGESCSDKPISATFSATSFTKHCYDEVIDLKMETVNAVNPTYHWIFIPLGITDTAKYTADQKGQSSLQPGVYKLTIKDTRHCESVAYTINVTGPTAPFKITETDYTLTPNCDNKTTLVLGTKLAAMPSKVLKRTGTTTQITDYTSLGKGAYTLQVTDAFGCTQSIDFQTSDVDIFAGVDLITSKDSICEGEEKVMLNAKAPAGITYTWDSNTNIAFNEDGNNQTVSVIQHGTYTITFNHAACNKTLSLAATVPAAIKCGEKSLFCESVAFVDFPEITTYDEPCSTRYLSASKAYSEYLYSQYLEKKKTDFKAAFAQKLMDGANESLVMSYTDKEQHYTLYYYDQAGNLVRTVPPAGVKVLDETKADEAVTAIKNADATTTVATDHTLTTTYTYNSLNQLVAQDMPDHERQQLVTLNTVASTLSGTINNLAINDNNALMLRTDGNGKALIYASADAGTTWAPQNGMGLGDVNDIAQTTTNAWAVGSNGLCMISNDLTATVWTVKATPVPTSGTYNFVKVIPSSVVSAYIIASDGTILNTNDGGNSFTTNYNLQAIGITIASFTNTATEWIVVTANGNVLQSTNNGITWTPVSNTFLPANFLYSAYDKTTSTSYFMGDKGVFYKLDQTNPTNPKLNSIPSSHTFNPGYFEVNNDVAYARELLTNKIYKATIASPVTTTLQWTEQTGITTTLPFTATNNGLIYVNNDGKIYNNTQSYTVANVNLIGYAYNNSINNPKIYAHSSSKVYSLTGGNLTPITIPATPTISGITQVATFGTDGILALTNTGNCYNLTSTSITTAITNVASLTQLADGVLLKLNDGTYKTTTNGTTFTAATPTYPSGNTITKIDGTSSALAVYSIGNNKFNFNNNTLTVQNQQIKSAHLGSQLLLAGDNSEVYLRNTDGTFSHQAFSDAETNIKSFAKARYLGTQIYLAAGANLYTINSNVLSIAKTVPTAIAGIASNTSDLAIWETTNTYQYKSGTWTTVPYTNPITALSLGTNIYIAGAANGGIAYKTPLATTYTQAPTSSIASLTKLYYQTATNPIAVGVSGTVVTGLGTSTQKVRYSKVTADLTQIAGNGNNVWAGGNNSTLIKSTDAGATWNTVSLPTGVTGNITALAVTSSGVYAAVGKKLLYWTNASVGSLQLPTTALIQTYNSAINGIFIKADGTGMLVGDNGLAVKLSPATVGSLQLPTTTLLTVDATPNDDQGTGIPNLNLASVSFTDNVTAYITATNNTVIKTTDGGDHWHQFTNKIATNIGVPLLAINANQQGALIEATGIAKSLSDKSDFVASRFWYDELGRLVLSQNAKQFNIAKHLSETELSTLNLSPSTPQAYSYTLYDAIGRIKEVGELITSETTALPLSGKYENQVRYAGVETLVNNPINTTRQIVKTYYDVPAFTISNPIANVASSPAATVGSLQLPTNTATFTQDNLRTRVASVTYQENPGTAYDQASHYSYDVHGNVKTLIVEIAQVNPNNQLLITNNKLAKRLDYDYDLVSGKVNTVTYQANQSDQFIHRYEYDSDNRITKVFTSKDGVLWDNDAKYQYYAHGPLARTVTGELAVETQNFAYTLQGWIKGLNGQNFSYALGYNSTDYTAIGTANNLATDIATGKDLYNGNIATWTSKNTKLSTTNWTQQFVYDQLNRIKEGTTLGGTNSYKNSYKYDPNGNITDLMRYSRTGDTLFDNLHYNYENTASSSNYKQNTNKLRSVDEPTSLTGLRADDIDDQDVDNYKYDEVGNLVFDDKEDIAKIEWTLNGKVKSITRKTGSTKDNLSFTYDPMGQRISKTVTPSTGVAITTYYVRDAAGNILATYNNTTLQEYDVYGSSRLGTVNNGQKMYELTDHLGNVRTVLSDNGLVLTSTDYYPFGMVASNYASDKYTYSYNGQMKVEELGVSHTTAEYWEYDGRLGRRWNVDPVNKHWESPYSTFNSNPILKTDPNGDDAKPNENVKNIVTKASESSNVDKPYSIADNYLIKHDGSIIVERTKDKTDNFKYQHSNGNVFNLGTFNKTDNGLVHITGNGISYDISNTKKTKRYMKPEAFAAFLGASMSYFKEYNMRIWVNQFSTINGGHSGHAGKGEFIDYRYTSTNGDKNEVVYTNGNNFDENKSQFMVDELVKFGYNSTPSNLRGSRYSILTQDGYSKSSALDKTSYYSGHYHHVHLQNYDSNHVKEVIIRNVFSIIPLYETGSGSFISPSTGNNLQDPHDR